MARIIAWILAAILALIVLLEATVGDAHDAYEPACCSNRDCFPVADALVTETSAGFRLNDTGEFVERASSKVRRPLDEQYHLCRNPDGVLLCIYPKFSGS